MFSDPSVRFPIIPSSYKYPIGGVQYKGREIESYQIIELKLNEAINRLKIKLSEGIT